MIGAFATWPSVADLECTTIHVGAAASGAGWDVDGVSCDERTAG